MTYLIQASALTSLSFLLRYPGQKIPLRSWVLDGNDLSLAADRERVDSLILSLIRDLAKVLDVTVNAESVGSGKDTRMLLWI